jgi:hypothetical protein
MKRFFSIGLLSLSLFLFSPSVLAKGIPSYFTIEGATIPRLFLRFDEAIVFDSFNEIEAPTSLEDEFYILRAYDIVDGQIIESQLSPMHYYPQADGSGIIYFVGARDRGIYQEFDENWYPAKLETSRILNPYIALGVMLKSGFERFSAGH